MPKIKGSVGAKQNRPSGKTKKSSGKTMQQKQSKNPALRASLGEEIVADVANKGLRKHPRKKVKRRAQHDAEDDMEIESAKNVLDKQMSKKLLESVEAQQREDELEEEMKNEVDMAGAVEEGVSATTAIFGSTDNLVDDDSALVDADGYIDVECTAEEEAAMQMFLPEFQQSAKSHAQEPNGLNLADIVTAALKEKSQKISAVNEAHEAHMETHEDQMSPKVIEVYTKIGAWLKHYKAGDLPKPFKIIPSLVNWEEILCLTNPLDWSPNAVAKATQIFASQLNARMAQRFYNMVLLPAVRQDMARNKKMNFHYYEALKKAMFKPAAFMKGILLPLAYESCTLHEAHIVTSVLSKISVPVLHASATLIKLAEMSPWYGTTAIFMASLINKKYSLPHSVIDTLVDHFYSFVEDERELPLVWHRCFLIFVQRYKNDFSIDQRDKLEKHLLKIHFHSGIGPECKRELQSVVPKGLFKPTGSNNPGKNNAMDLS